MPRTKCKCVPSFMCKLMLIFLIIIMLITGNIAFSTGNLSAWFGFFLSMLAIVAVLDVLRR